MKLEMLIESITTKTLQQKLYVYDNKIIVYISITRQTLCMSYYVYLVHVSVIIVQVLTIMPRGGFVPRIRRTRRRGIRGTHPRRTSSNEDIAQDVNDNNALMNSRNDHV